MKEYHHVFSKLTNKFELIGEGSFGYVFQTKNPKRVIRITQDLNDGWLSFAEMIMSGQLNGPNYPRIYSLYIQQNFAISLLEKLDKVPEDKAKLTRQIFSASNNFNSYNSTIKQIKNLDHTLWSEVLKLRQICNDGFFSFDLGGSNLMYRTDEDRIIINDPFYHANDFRSRCDKPLRYVSKEMI